MSPGKCSPRVDELQEPEASFVDHLEELRRRLLISLAALAAFSAASYFFSKPLVEFLATPLYRVHEAELYFQTPYEAFLTHLLVSVVGGALLASPVFFTQLWLFVAPGLHAKEKRVFVPLIVISTVLFLAGAAFSFWVLVPFGLQFLLSYQTDILRPLLGVGPYFSFLGTLILAGGLIFDLPVVVLGLVRAGLLSQQKLKDSRKFVVVGIFVVAAVLTPMPDPVSQLFLAIPLLVLFEVCVWCAKWVEKK